MALTDSFIKKDFTPEEEAFEQKEDALLEEMGITRGEPEKLRKMMLSADEAVHMKSEELERLRTKKNRKDNWQEFVDTKRRLGAVLYTNEVIKRLRVIIPSLKVVDGRVRNQVSLNRYTYRVFTDKWGQKTTKWGWEYMDWLQSPYSSEYEVDKVNDVGVAIGHKWRGYRTILLNLIKHKVITEAHAVEQFGEPTNGATASEYRRQLWEFRNGRKATPLWSF